MVVDYGVRKIRKGDIWRKRNSTSNDGWDFSDDLAMLNTLRTKSRPVALDHFSGLHTPTLSLSEAVFHAVIESTAISVS